VLLVRASATANGTAVACAVVAEPAPEGDGAAAIARAPRRYPREQKRADQMPRMPPPCPHTGNLADRRQVAEGCRLAPRATVSVRQPAWPLCAQRGSLPARARDCPVRSGAVVSHGRSTHFPASAMPRRRSPGPALPHCRGFLGVRQAKRLVTSRSGLVPAVSPWCSTPFRAVACSAYSLIATSGSRVALERERRRM
jgi:hypothetical protein